MDKLTQDIARMGGKRLAAHVLITLFDCLTVGVGTPKSPAEEASLAILEKQRLIHVQSTSDGPRWVPTERGACHIHALCELPFPVESKVYRHPITGEVQT